MDDAKLAELCHDGDDVVARMTRISSYPPSAIWRALTESGMLAHWLAPGRIEPRLGGAVRLDFADSGTVIDCQVSAFEAGRVLEYSWSAPGEPQRPVRWELAASGDGSVLTLAVRTPPGEDPGRACAGWEAHLAMLAAALDGAPIPFPFERFKAAREAYRPLVAALGAV